MKEGMMPVSTASRNSNKDTAMKTTALFLGLTVLLAACSPGDPDPRIAGHQREVMDDARHVEDVLQQSAEQARRQADEQAQ
jgi:hypothetical protein